MMAVIANGLDSSAQVRNLWRTLMNRVMISRAPPKAGNFLPSGMTISISRRTPLHGVNNIDKIVSNL
jgi:hypothetical protein